MGSRPARLRRGFTLLEVMIASVVLVIAIVGSFSLIFAVQTRNQTCSDDRLAMKACQEVMEKVLADSHNYADLEQWRAKWSGIGQQGDGGFWTPTILPVPVADNNDMNGNCELGRLQIRNLSAGVALPSVAKPTLPNCLYEIVVTIQGKARDGRQMTLRPLSVTLVSRRSSVR